MRQKINHIKSTLLLALLCGVASCSSDDIIVACPQISAPEQGARAYVKTDNAKSIVDVRFNGVNARCTQQDNDITRVEMSVGLKLVRDTSIAADDDVVSVGMMTAIVDANDKVISNDQPIYKAGFRANEIYKYPVADLEYDIVDGQRIVISLAPAL